MEFTNEQQAVINATEQKILVQAAAAAGKTATLVARVHKLLQDGIDPKSIVTITFTNAAAEEIFERLERPKGVFIGTIHSYANFLLLSHGIDTSKLIEEEKFDKLFPLVQKHPSCIKPVDYLLLDEAQDSTPLQFEFLLSMVNPTNYMLFFDHRQSIYRWNDADPQFLIDLMAEPDTTIYNLSRNYRNGTKILHFAKNIIQQAGADYRDFSIPMRNEAGAVITVDYSPTALANAILKRGNYKDWFILARTNDQVDQMMHQLQLLEIPCASFKRSELTNKEMYSLLKQDKVKVLTIHTSKGLEAKNVIVIGARFYNLEEKCISYVAATRARDLLVWTMQPKSHQKYAVSSWEA